MIIDIRSCKTLNMGYISRGYEHMPQATMIVGSQILGRSFFNSKLDGTSNAAYEKKNTVKHQLY